MAIYVDTSALIALKEKKERDHEAAKDALRSLSETGHLLVTGWHTVIEFADGLARHYSQKVAATEVGRLTSGPRLRIESSEPHVAAAIAILTKNVDWGIDLSDALSFAMMRNLGIKRVFTYDSDFEKADFELVG